MTSACPTDREYPMNDPLEAICAAIQDELRRQGVLYEVDEAEPDLAVLMMETGETARLRPVARAILTAMRQPSKAMLDAGITAAEEVEDYSTDTDEYPRRSDTPSDMPYPVWQAMIDEAIKASDGSIQRATFPA